jgi:hypothetical protein
LERNLSGPHLASHLKPTSASSTLRKM